MVVTDGLQLAGFDTQLVPLKSYFWMAHGPVDEQLDVVPSTHAAFAIVCEVASFFEGTEYGEPEAVSCVNAVPDAKVVGLSRAP
jgi:hypothetical protein